MIKNLLLSFYLNLPRFGEQVFISSSHSFLSLSLSLSEKPDTFEASKSQGFSLQICQPQLSLHLDFKCNSDSFHFASPLSSNFRAFLSLFPKTLSQDDLQFDHSISPWNPVIYRRRPRRPPPTATPPSPQMPRTAFSPSSSLSPKTPRCISSRASSPSASRS